MMHAKSESDVTSLAASSPPRSPKRAAAGNYYVQSPSRESHDGGYKSSSMQPTPVYNSPNESPSHPSYGRHSRASSVSRFSGNLRKGGAGEHKAINDKGWPECNVIEEEGSYDDLAGNRALSRRCQIIMGLLTFVLLFTTFCLIIWGAARPYEPEVVVKVHSPFMDNWSLMNLIYLLSLIYLFGFLSDMCLWIERFLIYNLTFELSAQLSVSFFLSVSVVGEKGYIIELSIV
jgi:hypothetical protein